MLGLEQVMKEDIIYEEVWLKDEKQWICIKVMKKDACKGGLV